jgi:hypothetical protein
MPGAAKLGYFDEQILMVKIKYCIMNSKHVELLQMVQLLLAHADSSQFYEKG